MQLSLLIHTFRNPECVSLPREIFQEVETEKEDIRERFYQCKNDFLDEFNEFRTNFFHEIKSFKNNILDTPPKNTGNQEHIITLLLDNIMALKNQSIFTTK